MEIITFKEPFLISEAILEKAVNSLLNKEILILPTETSYMLAGLADDISVLKKVSLVKGRSQDKPFSIAVPDPESVFLLGEKTELAEMLAKEYLPGSLTLILKKTPLAKKIIPDNEESIALRVPNHPVLKAIMKKLSESIMGDVINKKREISFRPLTATSANRSGGAEPFDLLTALKQLHDYQDYIALAIDAGVSQATSPSTILDLSQGKVQIVRSGEVPINQIKQFLAAKEIDFF